MDTSPEYVQMCRQAKEIQAQWKREPGDFIMNFHNEIMIFNRVISLPEYSISYTKNGETRIYTQEEWDKVGNIWLPRQDQLQAMLLENRPVLLQKLYEFYNHFRIKDGSPIFRVTSGWEQLWLCFTMHIVYKLQWNGSDWVAK